MRAVTKGGVSRSSTTTQGCACVLADHRAGGIDKFEIATQIQRTIRLWLDDCLGRYGFLLAAVDSPEVQRACRTRHDRLRDLIGIRCADDNPRATPGIENLGRGLDAILCVDTVRGLPSNDDLLVSIFFQHPWMHRIL